TIPLVTCSPPTPATVAERVVCPPALCVSGVIESSVRVACCDQAVKDVPEIHTAIHTAKTKPTGFIPACVPFLCRNNCRFILRVLCSLKKHPQHRHPAPNNHCIRGPDAHRESEKLRPRIRRIHLKRHDSRNKVSSATFSSLQTN